MSKVDVQRVGDSVLLVIDETQLLMPRDIAIRIGAALLNVGGLGGDTLDNLLCEPSQEQPSDAPAPSTVGNAQTDGAS